MHEDISHCSWLREDTEGKAEEVEDFSYKKQAWIN